MRCGLFVDFRNPKQWHRPWPDLYAQTLDVLEIADRAGLDEVWLSEHHFVEDGYLPSLPVAAAAIASRTTSIRVGTWVLLLPFYNAIRLAEDSAVVDVISRGRFDLGLGAGYRHKEFETFGISRDERRTRMDEGLEVLRELLDGEATASFSGEYYSFEDVTIGVEPIQKPFPLWLGARAKGAARRAARKGVHLMLAGPQEVYEEYAAGLEARGINPAQMRLAYRLQVLPTYDKPDRVFERIRPHVEYSFSTYAAWFQEAGDLKSDRSPERWMNVSERSGWIIGPPEHCVEEIVRRCGRLPVTDLIALTLQPGIDPREIVPALELFTDSVLPHLHALGAPADGVQ